MAHLIVLILMAVALLCAAAIAALNGLKTWEGALLLGLFLVFAPLHVVGVFRFLGILRELRRLGWTLTMRDLSFGIDRIREKDLKYVMRKEDFLVTPQYRSDRRDIQNILACIEFSKQEERSREVYDAIRPYIEEHEREDQKPAKEK